MMERDPVYRIVQPMLVDSCEGSYFGLVGIRLSSITNNDLLSIISKRMGGLFDIYPDIYPIPAENAWGYYPVYDWNGNLNEDPFILCIACSTHE